MTPHGEAPARHELLAFERVSARLMGRRQKRIAIGRYRMLAELGRGGFGAVYSARDPELERDVAVKLVKPRKGKRDAKWEARLVREAQTLAKVKHPHVVTVYDVGIDGESNGVYLVMELLQGLSARKWVKTTQPAMAHVIDAYISAARGLEAAHALGVVHRDFKPDNLMITHEGVAKVIDFGLAREVGEIESTVSRGGASSGSSALTSMGTVMGTPPYMAPEQHALGEIVPATDQYALCVSLFEALYGQRPFEADDVEALYKAKSDLAITKLPKRHGVARAVHRVLLRGLSPNPAHRWPSMAALADALGQASRPRRGVYGALLGILSAMGLAVASAALVTEEDDACSSLAARGETVWSSARASTVQARVLRDEQGPDATVWAAAQGRLDTAMGAWRTTLDEACAAQASETVTCLDQWLRDADTVVTVLESEGVSAGSTLAVVDTLPPLEQCAASAPLSRLDDVPLRDGLTRARALARAGSGDEALALADALVEEARATDNDGLIAQASLTAGLVYAERERLDDARRVLIEGHTRADAIGLDAVAAESAIVLVRVCGAMGRFDDAHQWQALAEARLSRLGDPPYLRTLLLAAQAFELIYEGDFAQAYAISLELVDRLPAETKAFERGRAMANVALTAFELGRAAEARAVVAEARMLMVSVLGDEHAAVARMLSDEGRYAAAEGDVEGGVATMERAVALLEAAGGPNDPYALNTKRTLAHYLLLLGRDAESLAMLEQTYASTVELYGLVHVRTATTGYALADAYLMADRPSDAERLTRDAMTSLSELYGAQHPRLAVGAEQLGRALSMQGKPAEARDVVTRALAGLTEATPGERESRVNLLMTLAGIDQDAGRLDDAVRNLERAIDFAEHDAAISDPALLASLEGARAFAEAERGQSDRAVEAANRTLAFLERIGAPAEAKAEYQALIDSGGTAP